MLCFVSESTDESEADKIHCLNNSVSSGTYSDYSPSQASSGSSNAHVKMGSLQTTAKDAVNNSLWGNRCDPLSLTQLPTAFCLMLPYTFKVIMYCLLRYSDQNHNILPQLSGGVHSHTWPRLWSIGHPFILYKCQ